MSNSGSEYNQSILHAFIETSQWHSLVQLIDASKYSTQEDVCWLCANNATLSHFVWGWNIPRLRNHNGYWGTAVYKYDPASAKHQICVTSSLRDISILLSKA
jgi:hypothetical protein